MKKAVLVLVAMALVPCCALAVDGVVLINSSTVMAAGGFPYIVSQPGSYKLSGNLTPPVNTNAINITASFVTLDLGGFTVSCSADLNQVVNCITDTASITNLAILNGSIKIVQPLTNPVIPTITITGINMALELSWCMTFPFLLTTSTLQHLQ